MAGMFIDKAVRTNALPVIIDGFTARIKMHILIIRVTIEQIFPNLYVRQLVAFYREFSGAKNFVTVKFANIITNLVHTKKSVTFSLNLVITHSDKANVTVIMNKVQYIIWLFV